MVVITPQMMVKLLKNQHKLEMGGSKIRKIHFNTAAYKKKKKKKKARLSTPSST